MRTLALALLFIVMVSPALADDDNTFSYCDVDITETIEMQGELGLFASIRILPPEEIGPLVASLEDKLGRRFGAVEEVAVAVGRDFDRIIITDKGGCTTLVDRPLTFS